MADTDIMRGLAALDQIIIDANGGAGAPGSGLYLLLDGLAVSTLGVPRSAMPAADASRSDRDAGDATRGGDDDEQPAKPFEPWRGP